MSTGEATGERSSLRELFSQRTAMITPEMDVEEGLGASGLSQDSPSQQRVQLPKYVTQDPPPSWIYPPTHPASGSSPPLSSGPTAGSRQIQPYGKGPCSRKQAIRTFKEDDFEYL